MSKDLIIQNKTVATDDYNQLIDNISSLWVTAKEKAINAVNTELLEDHIHLENETSDVHLILTTNESEASTKFQ